MTPGGSDGVTGILMVSSQDGLRPACSDECLRTCEVAVQTSSRTTVQGLVEKFVSGRFTRYRYNDQGMGCRWWCEVVIRKLEEDGYVEEGTVSSLERWWLDAAANDQRIPFASVKGSFY